MMVCESPLHAGTGSDLDFIDNPIQRERHTLYPKIESSSLKGAIRERFSKRDRKDSAIDAVFGPDMAEAGKERQGALGFSDARLLLFPVKSMRGVFAWVTSPAVLQRFQADLMRFWENKEIRITGIASPSKDSVFVFSNGLIIKNAENQEHVVLEEFAYEVETMPAPILVDGVPINQWLADLLFPITEEDQRHAYWNSLLQHNLLILPDTDFADFTELTTEIITRNKIDTATGTVANGHLFTEEYLPSDSVMYSFVLAHSEFKSKKDIEDTGAPKDAKEILEYFKNQMQEVHANAFQVGGNATIGKGLMRTVLL